MFIPIYTNKVSHEFCIEIGIQKEDKYNKLFIQMDMYVNEYPYTACVPFLNIDKLEKYNRSSIEAHYIQCIDILLSTVTSMASSGVAYLGTVNALNEIMEKGLIQSDIYYKLVNDIKEYVTYTIDRTGLHLKFINEPSDKLDKLVYYLCALSNVNRYIEKYDCMELNSDVETINEHDKTIEIDHIYYNGYIKYSDGKYYKGCFAIKHASTDVIFTANKTLEVKDELQNYTQKVM